MPFSFAKVTEYHNCHPVCNLLLIACKSESLCRLIITQRLYFHLVCLYCLSTSNIRHQHRFTILIIFLLSISLQYAIFLSLLLLIELSLGTLAFVLKDKGWVRKFLTSSDTIKNSSLFSQQIKDRATEGLRTFITHYREDPDQQNLIDWIQEDWLQCCGIEGPKDWDNNNYFNCSSSAVGSREACGVPFSCCKQKPNEFIKNKQCGYDVRKENYVSRKINANCPH